MYIEEVKLFNIRSFQNQSINFSKNINIIIGENNSGKSTLIKSIYLLQDRNALRTDDVRKTKNLGHVFVTIKEIGSNDKLSFINSENLGNTLQFKQSVVLTAIQNEGTKKSTSQKLFQADSIKSINEDGFISKIAETPGAQAHFSGLSNDETQSSFIYPFLSKRKTNFFASKVDSKDSNSIGDDYRYFIAKIKKLTNPGHPSSKKFVDLCDKILGFKIGIIAAENQMDSLGFYVTGHEIISIQQTGDGVMQIIFLIALILTEDNKLYLIEELENDLHPSALKELLELIIQKSKSNQFIISTHSNIVLRYLGICENTKIITTKTQFTKVEGPDDYYIPTSELKEIVNSPEERIKVLMNLGYELWDFELFKAYLLLEESSAESIIRELLIPAFIPSMLNKIKTIAASGAADMEPRFHDFLRIFVFINSNSIYNERAWIIADGDKEGKKHIESIRNSFKNWPPKHFMNFSKDNFEEYYPERFSDSVKEMQVELDNRKKRDKKIRLTMDVVDWIRNNYELAKQEFAISAKEVINILKEMEGKL
ncbi:MAG TPA: AAA family ATPase [Puia sp.]|nr:AAA family ATPase [Puia sp.]